MGRSGTVRVTASVLATLSAMAPVAAASNGALAQLPGQAACVSNNTYGGTRDLCRQGVGVRLIQSLAISPDGSSLYTASVQSQAVGAFSRQQTTGLLTQVSGGGGCIQDPSASSEPGCIVGRALQIPDWVTVSPNGANVYASAFTSQAVDVFSRDSATGALRQLTGSPGCISSSSSETSCSSALALQGAGVVELSPDGRNAYVASFGNNLSNTGAVAIFAVGSNGVLTQLGSGLGCIVDMTAIVPGCTTSPDDALRGVGSVAISPDGNFVYVAARDSQAVTIYQRDAATGALARIQTSGGCLEEAGTSPCAQGAAVNGLEGPELDRDLARRQPRLHLVVRAKRGEHDRDDRGGVFS